VDVGGEALDELAEQGDGSVVADLGRARGRVAVLLVVAVLERHQGVLVGVLLAGEALAVVLEVELGEAEQDLRGPGGVVGVFDEEFFVAGDGVGAQAAGLLVALGDAAAELFVEADAALLGLDGDDDRQGVAADAGGVAVAGGDLLEDGEGGGVLGGLGLQRARGDQAGGVAATGGLAGGARAGLAAQALPQVLGARELGARQRGRGDRRQQGDQSQETCPFVHVPHCMSSRTWSRARSSSLKPWSRVRSICSASSCSACWTAQATSSWPTSLRVVQ
jgi:hypothetical protein